MPWQEVSTVSAALPHPTSPYKGEETASGESVKLVHE
jgi:hypothetical protein